MTVPVNATQPVGVLGQTLSFVLDFVVPPGATLDLTKAAVTTNAPGAVVTLATAANPPGQTGQGTYTLGGTVSSPNASGTFQISGTVNGVDEQDVVVTWNDPPQETIVFDPAGFSFA